MSSTPSPLPLEGKTPNLFGIPLHRRIVTGQKHIPWSAVFILSLVWFTWGFHIFAGGLALTFTIQHYTNDPRIIAFVQNINVIVMLGPFISYISDQVWTRLGRRRPFMIAAWAGACIAMFTFAFLPQIAAAVGAILGPIGITVTEFGLLIVMITGYTTLYDLQAPLEPLFLECVPPHQRGRFFAIRGILFKLAVLLFFQVLWARYDKAADMFAWLGLPGKLSLSGEQCIYILAGSLFGITGAFLLFNVYEVQDPKAPNKRMRDLFLGERKAQTHQTSGAGAGNDEAPPVLAYARAEPPRGILGTLKSIPIVAFFTNYVKDVFLTWSNYPFYIVLVIPGIEQTVWGNFGNIMQTKQFGYSMANQALWGLPMTLLGMIILTPFSGWYSDTKTRIPFWLRQLSLLLGLGFIGAGWWMYKTYAPADIRELPGWHMMFAIAIATALGCMATLVWMIETLLAFVGHEHARAWASMLAVVLGLAVNIALFTTMQCAPDKTIPITLFMMLNVCNGAFGSLLETFVGPMIYEYMPRSKMGTINSGRGLMGDGLRWLINNLGGWWIWWYSIRTFYPNQPEISAEEMKYDYTAMYMLMFVLFIPVVWSQAWFLKQVIQGRIKKWGIIEVEGEEGGEPAEEKQPATV